jgi:hypothetical protein
MIIREIKPQSDWILGIKDEDGREGHFDVRPYLDYEAFADLRDHDEFRKVANGGYFVEWESGADLSADTIEAGWHVQQSSQSAA